MSEGLDKNMEKSIVEMVNDHDDTKINLENYQRVEIYIYEEEILKSIMHVCKFKDIGSVYDFPDQLPQPESVYGFAVSTNFDLFQRIAVSKKLNSILYFSSSDYSIFCTFLIDISKLKKFSKLIKDIVKRDGNVNIFRDVDFDCKSGEYIEISDPIEDKKKMVDALKKQVPEENLVFDEKSTINDVMNNILAFFKNETKELYKKLDLPYKRGVILYGDPGNGKSAMIREIIRIMPNITKIIINPNVMNVTKVLSTLTRALNGRQSIIIIEDIDSLITERNRSEFLNILDGVEIKSGIYFIGTTNYPDKIDPAFINRSGRFDRSYSIGNPSEVTRRAFFESRKIGKLFDEYKTFKDTNISDSNDGVVKLFVKNSEELPMASLKELITSTSYLLATNNDMTVEEAVENSFNTIKSTREEHSNAHLDYKQRMNNMNYNPNMGRQYSTMGRI